MIKKRIEYDSPVEVLIAIAKRLNALESRYRKSSEDFFDQYTKGDLEDSVDFVEWANDYRHFLAIKLDLEEMMRHAAQSAHPIPA
jgi:hypothetical protein